MTIGDQEGLSPEQELALAYCAPEVREPLATLLALDRRLARIVGNSEEPMLAQMRLAWWRDELAKPRDERPGGDLVLDEIGRHWAGDEAALIELVNAWEVMIAAEALTKDAVQNFAQGRAAPIQRLAARWGEQRAKRTRLAAMRWAIADAAAHVSDGRERGVLLEHGKSLPTQSGAVPRSLRGIAVLEALGLRAMARGGRPLMEGRGAAALVLRVGLLGR